MWIRFAAATLPALHHPPIFRIDRGRVTPPQRQKDLCTPSNAAAKEKEQVGVGAVE